MPTMSVARAVVMMPVLAKDLVLGLATAGSGTGPTPLLCHSLRIGKGALWLPARVLYGVSSKTERSAGPILITVRTNSL